MVGKSGKKAVTIIIISVVLGFVAEYMEQKEGILKDGVLTRNAAGKGEVVAALEYQENGKSVGNQIEITIAEQELTEAEWKECLAEGEQELDTLFLADNSDTSHITKQVNLCETVQDGLIRVSWEFTPDNLIDTSGKVMEECIEEEGQLVEATATLSYHDYSAIYSFSMALYHETKSEEELLEEMILSHIDSQDATKQYIELPDKLAGNEIYWTLPKSYTAWIIALLGMVAATGVIVGEHYEDNELRKKREKELARDYPEIVSQLGLLLEAGMALNQAWTRMLTSYAKKRKAHQISDRAGYEQMQLTLHELQDGIGEQAAFDRFGERCGLAQYRRLAAILSQSVTKGAAGIAGQLSKEAEDAFFQRRNQAERLGEEAGTKLLFPMMIMLVMVMAILVIPACMGMQI